MATSRLRPGTGSGSGSGCGSALGSELKSEESATLWSSYPRHPQHQLHHPQHQLHPSQHQLHHPRHQLHHPQHHHPSCSALLPPASPLLHHHHHHHHHHILLPLLLLLLLQQALPVGGTQQVLLRPAQAARGGAMQCWEAEIRCLQETECKRAYNQYLRACEAALRPAASGDVADEADGGGGGGGGGGGFSAVTHCPSHCIHAIIQLNATRGGPGLESCDCAHDFVCLAAKRGIEPCLPRTYTGGGGGGEDEYDDDDDEYGGDGGGRVRGAGGGAGGGALGCTEARRRCEVEPACSAAMDAYLMNCGKLLNGVRCTRECMRVILHMMAMPRALALSECVCDGLERPFCEVVKDNMERLCFDRERGSGDFADEDDDDDEDDDEGDDEDDDGDDDEDGGYGDNAAAYGVGRHARQKASGSADGTHSVRVFPRGQPRTAGQRRPLASVVLTAAACLAASAAWRLSR
ncbi:growth arrest-specific protein 1-like [Lethenteron reissneri]|uniref:growth arrest-specific protein 1-like n=1 Tax=Lethenteron reissneri TaxID=7753 RepID=UPI002AB69273|nr:growth arrest-specific protein 1-like [Lethenteron reissneri]